MKNFLSYSLCFLAMTIVVNAQKKPGLKYESNQTLRYEEVIESYQFLAANYADGELMEVGTTDCGRPLHLFVMGQGVKADLNLQQIAEGKTVILINNGIHPGESAGIDASIEFCEALLKKGMPEDLLIAVIPLYNVGGSLNRGAYSRANQNGPEEHGFRGNARNLDLNRDFIKADALNTFSFYAIFHALRPHIFVDTHTSNGADYQYTMTLISTQQDKLNPVLAEYMTSEMEPFLYREMDKAGWEMTPYVNVFGRVPDPGFAAFLETPRFASGYTTLFNTIGFITETHMLKPYADRVEATRSFLELLTQYAINNGQTIRDKKEEALANDREQKYLALNWQLDSSRFRELDFKGYEYQYEPSKLGDYERLKYLQDQPKSISIPYYERFVATDSAAVPDYYILPQAWREVITRLQYNQVEMEPLQKDTVISVQCSYFTDFDFSAFPYEGHHVVSRLDTRDTVIERRFFAGDYLISTEQPALRYLVSVLEPKAVDSFVRWNFFDEVFQQKEHYSAYVFEDTAEQLLQNDPDLKSAFEQWKTEHPDQAKSAYATLNFIYRRSPYYEPTHLLYPVGRIF